MVHAYAYATTPACGGRIYRKSSAISHLIFFNFLSSTEPKAHESAKLPGSWAPRSFKAPLLSTGITGMCHQAHFRRLKGLRGRKTFYKETRGYVFIR